MLNFCYNFFFFYFTLPKVITLPTVEITIFVALSRLEALAYSFPLLAIAGRVITIWRAIQKKSPEQIYKTGTKRSKEAKIDNFCYREVGRAITKWGSIEKSPILRKQYWNNYYFDRIPKIIPLFDVTNTIFVNSMMTVKVKRVNGITVAKR